MIKTVVAASFLCAAAMSAALGSASLAEDTSAELQPVLFDGVVQSVEAERFTMNRRLEGGFEEVIVNVAEDTRILDAVNGFPKSAESLKEGGKIRVYVGPAMTMSLPPITTARVVLTDIPEDFNVPFYETVSALEQNQDGSYTAVAVSGNKYQIDESTRLLPYLTRNIVCAGDLLPGVNFLVWTSSPEAGKPAEKIVIFQGGK